MNLLAADVSGQDWVVWVDVAMWGVFSFLVLFIALGMFFGLVRGRNRTGIRILTLLVFLPLALLLTPVFSKMFLQVFMQLLKIEIPFLDNQSIWGLLESFIVNNAGADALTMPQLMDTINGIFLAVINVVMFWILYCVFKGLSWIIYSVIVIKVCPKKKADGAPVKRHRISGMFLGVVQAVVFFAFFMIPVTGVMYALQDASNYHSSMANFSTTEGRNAHESGLMDIYNSIDGAGTVVQNHTVGVITKYTGLQALGSMGMDYLMSYNSQGQTFNVKNDAVSLVRVFKDLVAVEAELDLDIIGGNSEGGQTLFDQISEKVPEKIKGWTVSKYTAVQETIGHMFDISIVDIFADSIGSFTDVGVSVLKNAAGIDIYEVLKISDDEEVNKTFADSVIGVAGSLTSDGIRGDLQNAIELVRLLFGGNDGEGLYPLIEDVTAKIENSGELTAAADVLTDALIYPCDTVSEAKANVEQTAVYQLMSCLFDFKIVRTVLDDEKLSNVYKLPLEQSLPQIADDEYFKLNLGENWDTTSADFSNIILSAVDCAPVVGSFKNNMDGEDGYFGAVIALTEDDVKTVAALLQSLTDNTSIGDFIRVLVADLLDSVYEKLDIASQVELAQSSQDMIDTMRTYLDDVNQILDELQNSSADYEEELNSLKQIIEDLKQQYGEDFYEQVSAELGEEVANILAFIEDSESAEADLEEIVVSVRAEIDRLVTEINTIMNAVERVTHIREVIDDIHPSSKKEFNWESELLDIYNTLKIAKDFF